jgi:hypothetical protein
MNRGITLEFFQNETISYDVVVEIQHCIFKNPWSPEAQRVNFNVFRILKNPFRNSEDPRIESSLHQ